MWESRDTYPSDLAFPDGGTSKPHRSKYILVVDRFMKLPRPWLHTPLFPLCKTSCGLLSAPFFCMHLGGFSDAYVCNSWVLRVHTSFRPHVGMQLLGAPSAYQLPASCWYATLGCSECI